MKEHDIDKNLINNIEISDEMRESLIQDVKSGKRSKDTRFRYSTTLMALCVIGVLVISGSSASAAYISYKNRVENMPQEEQQEYVEELENDDYYAVDESQQTHLNQRVFSGSMLFNARWNSLTGAVALYSTKGFHRLTTMQLGYQWNHLKGSVKTADITLTAENWKWQNSIVASLHLHF